jgi:cytidine deaminase
MSLYKIVNTFPIEKISKKILKIISNTANVAERSDFDSSKRLGACLEIKRQIFYGHNLHRTRFGKTQYQSLHAEVNVILQALKSFERNATLHTKQKLSSSTVYVVRILSNTEDNHTTRSHKFGMSKPCLNCQQHLKKYNVKRIFYTDIINGNEVLCEMRML